MKRLLLLVVLSLGWTSLAWAHGSAASKPKASVSDLVPSPVKKKLLAARAKAREAKIAPATLARPIDEAVRAMGRARGAKAAGDVRHGAMLVKLAGQWADVAHAIVNAAIAEKKAKAQAEHAQKLKAKLERARMLLTEQQARRGRLEAELGKVTRKRKAGADTAAAQEKKRVEKAEKRSEKGSKKGAKRPKKKVRKKTAPKKAARKDVVKKATPEKGPKKSRARGGEKR